MKFKQHSVYKQFYYVDENKNILVFIKDYQEGTITISKLIDVTFNKKFIILFCYEEYTDTTLKNSNDPLNAEISSSFVSGFNWIEDFGIDNTIRLRNKPEIKFKVNLGVLVGEFSNFRFNNQFRFNTNGNKPLIKILDSNISLESTGDIELICDNKYLSFKKAEILLSKTDCGCLSFTNERKEELIQPVSQNIGSSFNILATHFFDKKQYDKESEIEVYYFPYPQKSVLNHSESNLFQTRFELKNKPLRANIIDKLAKQMILDSPVKAVVGFTEYKDGELPSEGPFYHFMPYGEVAFKSNETNFKIGASGTESVNSDNSRLVLNFKKDAKVKVNKDKNDLEPSLNSVSTKPIIKYQLFNLDSEKSPLFKNSPINGEIDYDSIPFPSIVVDKPLPIIPTLSFKDNPELFELEEVFKKIRLKAHQKVRAKKLNKSGDDVDYLESPEDYITPQGFQKNRTGYDFINKQHKANKPEEFDFQFSLEGIDTNLDLSLRKDQVFFVLTPALFKKYCDTVNNAKLSAKFAINKDAGNNPIEFIVDLEAYLPENLYNASPSKTIIIFKFHREKLSTLINDLKLWTNEGLLNNDTKTTKGVDDLETIQKAITNAQGEIKNDEYFNGKNGSKGILDDENWNGVLMLNIPISNSNNLPKIFKGLSSSQDFFKKETNRISLDTKLKFQYAAFPVNKTKIENGKIEIKSTSFYGLIDYNPFKLKSDYEKLSAHLKPTKDQDKNEYQFLLSKLFVEFRNSSISKFISGAFIRIPKLFDDSVTLKEIPITNESESYPSYQVSGENLIRLDGSYQKNSSGEGEISFAGYMNGNIDFNGAIIKSLELKKLGFSIIDKDKDEYRFDIDTKVNFADSIGGIGNLFSFDELNFQNIGLRFDLGSLKIPLPKFDLSKLIVLPKISFDGNGFLRSFPIRLSHFQNFRLPVIPSGGKFNFGKPDFDFFAVKVPTITFDWLDWKPESFGNLFSFIFDFDLGTLGNLGGLKDLKGQLLIGWTFKGGFAIGFKLNGSSTEEIHLDLFGALKLDAKLKLCSFIKGATKSYFLRLVNPRLTIFGTELPPKDYQVDGIIYANPFDESKKKTAWFIATLKDKKLLLGLGQRVGIDLNGINKVDDGINKIRQVFDVNIPDCNDGNSTEPVISFYKPERNWLIASEKIIPDSWPIDLKFIFNDPDLYGIHLGFSSLDFYIDILYKKLSDSLGVYSTEIQLPDDLRNMDLGGASLRLPNIGIEIYTNGDWKGDIGFPKNGNDWSRSGFIQLNTAPPFVGWFGFYIMKSKVASLTLFKGYISDKYSQKYLNIIQAGFAMRVGLGAYIDEGIYYIGASITVYGILEGSFAFKKESGMKSLFPDHFAVLGRVGAIAELVGYVDFKIIKASIRMTLRAEFGLLLVYTSAKGSDYELIDANLPDIPANRLYFSDNIKQGKGIQPVKVYIEGEVVVAISVTLFCVKFFRKKWCLVVHLRFRAYVRFEYTIGGGGSSNKIAAKQQFKLLEASDVQSHEWKLESIKELPMVFIPTFTRRKESTTDKEETLLLSNFYIPFFGVKVKDGKLEPSKLNIFKDKIIQPFINDLITKVKEEVGTGNVTYEHLRGVLLEGKLVDVDASIDAEVKITIPNYRPKFIDGTNENDWNKLKAILEEEFYFKKYDDIDEFDEFKKAIEIEDCLNLNSANHKCPYRAIPAPISKNINVGGVSVEGGFNLQIEELVAPNVNILIGDLPIYNSYLDKLEDFFSDYKTQFTERNKKTFKKADTRYDLRESFLIPEFFKLVALLTLEKAYSQANPKKKSGEVYNPSVTVIDGDIVFDKTIPIQTNNNIEEIIGQINYFYNSGLRLPNDEIKDNEDTISINELIGQYKIITPIKNPTPDAWKDVKISIAGQDITNNIYGSGSDKKESVEGIWKFVDSLGNTDFTELKNEFKPIKFIRPYKLINVTLGIQSNHKKVLNPDKSESRFYEIPKKIFKLGIKEFSKFEFELTAAKYENTIGNSLKDEVKVSSLLTGSSKLEFSKCLNVEIQVKQSSNENGKVILELTNVLTDDLTLITLLKDEKFDIENILFYGKVEENGQTKLIKLTNTGSTIIKTNLSPRTSPPIFDTKKFKKAIEALNLKQFVEDSNNPLDIGKQNFTKLVWEALTTNSGGYYLAFDSFPNEVKELKEIVISFESDSTPQEIPYFFNSLKIDNIKDIENNKDLFTLLDENKLYLYIDQLKQDKEPVLEYHPTIPAHDFGFEILKDQSTEERYQQYLPLEFELSNITDRTNILNKDKVLPILPSGPFKAEGKGDNWKLVLDKDHKKIEDEKGKLLYSHISPLITDVDGKDINNIHRYSTVGREYKLKLGLRDIYGFRTSIDFKEKEKDYKHLYFDKLIPVDAWPLIKFSYWFTSYSENTDTLNWTLKGNYDIRELLDLAGIERKENGDYAYKFGDKIDGEDLDKIRDVSEGILNSLYTIAAQLIDSDTTLSIKNCNQSNVQELIRKKFYLSEKELVSNPKLNSLIGDIQLVRSGTFPSDDSKKFIELTLTTSGLKANEIESKISFEISLNRNKNTIQDALDSDYTSSDISHSFKDLKSKASIWEYEAVEKVSTRIQASSGDDGTSNLKALNAVIKEKTREIKVDVKSNRYSLAISVDKNLDKVVYLINDKVLKQLKVKSDYLNGDKFKAEKSYLGIKPISNKLWFGKYEYKDKISEFSNVDLDKRLRIVLEEIDDLLSKDSISSKLKANNPTEESNRKALFEKLIAAKKAIAENKLSEQVDWVMASIDASIAKDEFKEIILNKLTNFYAYDGVVSSEVENTTVLNGYRLSVSLDSQKNYNLISSKIQEGKWNIFFDQQEIERDKEHANIKFSIIPKITHIERDIQKVEESEIEKSTWIQLLDPIEPTIKEYEVTEWAKIIREFPLKPVITKHEAVQSKMPNENVWSIDSKTNFPDAGKWNYYLSVEDKLDGKTDTFKYQDNDRIEIKLLIQSLKNKSANFERSFEGLIAYWSDKITNSSKDDLFNWNDFTNDLFEFFQKRKIHQKSEDIAPQVVLIALEKKNKVWNLENDDLGNGLKVALVSTDNPELTISGFNIFNSEQKAFSILPQVRVFRNHWVVNMEFRYETDEVQPASPVTPLIKHYKPLGINKSETFSEKVFKFKNHKFPFKATAKYLVDINANFPSRNTQPLPVIPVKLIEGDQGYIENPDEIFDPFDKANGYAAFSYTIYNDSDTNGDLPIFYAETIFKSKT